MQEVGLKQPDYDTVSSSGKNMLRLAHPQGVGVLTSKLQLLERKWLDLRGRLGRPPRHDVVTMVTVDGAHLSVSH